MRVTDLTKFYLANLRQARVMSGGHTQTGVPQVDGYFNGIVDVARDFRELMRERRYGKGSFGSDRRAPHKPL
jgi:hypothetical protein